MNKGFLKRRAWLLKIIARPVFFVSNILDKTLMRRGSIRFITKLLTSTIPPRWWKAAWPMCGCEMRERQREAAPAAVMTRIVIVRIKIATAAAAAAIPAEIITILLW